MLRNKLIKNKIKKQKVQNKNNFNNKMKRRGNNLKLKLIIKKYLLKKK